MVNVHYSWDLEFQVVSNVCYLKIFLKIRGWNACQVSCPMHGRIAIVSLEFEAVNHPYLQPVGIEDDFRLGKENWTNSNPPFGLLVCGLHCKLAASILSGDFLFQSVATHTVIRIWHCVGGPLVYPDFAFQQVVGGCVKPVLLHRSTSPELTTVLRNSFCGSEQVLVNNRARAAQ